jgi:hypothetical protein
MATAKKISQLTAVSVPAGTDVLAAKQGSTTKKLTVTQLLTLQDAALATITQAAAEAGTATDRRIFTAQRVAQAIAALAGAASFELVVDNDTIETGELFSCEVATAKTITIAATIAALDEFVIHNSTQSAGVLSIEPNTGHTINGPFGSAVGGTDTIVVAPGETIRLLATSSALMEII